MSEAKIKAIIKRPDEKVGHMTNISASLGNLQRTVDGPIELIRFGPNVKILCNEEGKLRGLAPNFRLPNYGELVGTIIVVGEKDGEFADTPISFKEWKECLKAWEFFYEGKV